MSTFLLKVKNNNNTFMSCDKFYEYSADKLQCMRTRWSLVYGIRYIISY